MAATEPSELVTCMKATSSPLPGSTESTPSPPTPRRQSQSHIASSGESGAAGSATRKSLPRPWYFTKERVTRCSAQAR